MNDALDPVYIDETHRVRLEYEQGSPNPREDWDVWITAFVSVYATSYHSPPALFDVDADIHRAARDLDDTDIVRWLAIFHGLAAQYDSEYGGYWVFSPEGWLVTNGAFPVPPLDKQHEIITGEREMYRQWSEGEVFTIVAEEAEELFHKDRQVTGQYVYDHTDWMIVDSVGGIYLDDTSYTHDEAGVRRMANEHFGAEWETKEITAA